MMMMTHSDTDQETLIHPDPGHHDQDIVFSDLIYDVIIRVSEEEDGAGIVVANIWSPLSSL